jgi:hypothetical protein
MSEMPTPFFQAGARILALAAILCSAHAPAAAFAAAGPAPSTAAVEPSAPSRPPASTAGAPALPAVKPAKAAASRGFTALAASALASPPSGPPFCGVGNPFGRAIVCVQEYALCIAAPCVLIPGSSSSQGFPQATCECLTLRGASIGEASCQDRAPTLSPGHRLLVSTYSYQLDLPGYNLMTCPSAVNGTTLRYADCYNMPCREDPHDPAKSICTCPVLEAKVGDQPLTFITRGGKCDTTACSSPTTIWSGAPTQADEWVNWQFACDLGMPHPPDPLRCPGQ